MTGGEEEEEEPDVPAETPVAPPADPRAKAAPAPRKPKAEREHEYVVKLLLLGDSGTVLPLRAVAADRDWRVPPPSSPRPVRVQVWGRPV